MKLFNRIPLFSSTQRFLRFFEDYISRYGKKDRRVVKQAYEHFKTFISFNKTIKIEDKDTISEFLLFLQARCKGSGAASIYGRFRKVTKEAYRLGIIRINPCSDIRCSSSDTLVKAILSESEITKIIMTHYKHENNDIRRAFILCLYTGIRFCDVRKLRYCDIDYSNRILSFDQEKTKNKSRRSHVHIPIREDILENILMPLKADRHDLIFRLPSHPTCIKHLHRWMNACGIRKHITWHCARHTFATNILKHGTDVRTIADLLGHSSLKYVEKYTRAIDEVKIKAVNCLPKLPI